MNMKIFVAALALITIASFSAVSAAPSEPTYYKFSHFNSAEECIHLVKDGLCTDVTGSNTSCTCATPVYQFAGVPNLYTEGEDGANFGSVRVCNDTFVEKEPENKSPYVCMSDFFRPMGEEGHTTCKCFDLVPQE